MERDELVCSYYALGLSQKEVVTLLKSRHGYSISERHLRRIIRKYGLGRRACSDVIEVANFISNQLDSTGQNHGYRFMYLRCLLAGFYVSRETVRLIMQELDPEGVNLRQSRRLLRRRYGAKGPNSTWHLDSYDKLKPYGITINGCIDGFSRYIIWMECSSAPTAKLIEGYFVQAVENSGGCPIVVRADRGTENNIVRQIQVFCREQGDIRAGNNSFIYGKSTANQRIESWWSTLRRQNTQFWISLFSELKAHAYFNGEAVEKELIRFVFMDLIQEELGRPYFMYTSPESYGTTDQLVPVDQTYSNLCREECVFKSEIHCDIDLHELCLQVMQGRGWTKPAHPHGAKELYIHLREEIFQLLI